MDYGNLEFKFVHMGVNNEKEKSALKFADFFEKVFDFKRKESQENIFVNSEIEIMKSKGYGTHGHIGIATNNIFLAMEYLESLGFEFLEESKKYNEKNQLILIYLKEELSGFAIHLLQN